MTEQTDEQRAQRLACATYTHARRHPMVIGQIAGWTPPFQLSAAQIAVLLITILVESQTWRWWGTHLPGTVGVAVAIGLPWTLTWVVRRGRLEGRSLARTALGWLLLWSRPRAGRVGGRPLRVPRPQRSRAVRVFLAAGPTARIGHARSTPFARSAREDSW